MQIHELSTFTGTPTSSDYLAIDNSTTTTKIGATGLGVQDKLTVAEANTGTSTASRIVTPKVVHDYVVQDTTHITSATKTKWSGITSGDGSIENIADYLGDKYTENITEPSITTTTGKLNSKEVCKRDGIVTLRINVENASQISAGSNLYAGQLDDASLYPKYLTRSISYSGSSAAIGQVGTSGAITIRVIASAWAAASATSISFIYMI